MILREVWELGMHKYANKYCKAIKIMIKITFIDSHEIMLSQIKKYRLKNITLKWYFYVNNILVIYILECLIFKISMHAFNKTAKKT